MIGVKKIVGASILSDSYSCANFTGLLIKKDGRNVYIRSPYTTSLKNGIVTIVSSYGETISFPNSEYRKRDIDGINFDLDQQTLSVTGGMLVISNGNSIPLDSISTTSQAIVPIDTSVTTGETTYTYPTPLASNIAPSLTAIIGDDDINFSIQIKSYDANGVTFLTFDESGDLYNGNGSVLVITH